MGRAHARAFLSARSVYVLSPAPVLDLIADQDAEQAAAAAAVLGFARSTGDWRRVVVDPDVDLVAIATPNLLHAPIALAALQAGKAVYCEKPLAATLEDATAMVAASEAAGLPTGVGFTYLHNPMIGLAREIIASGEIGEVTAFRGAHAEDFMAAASAPFNWRCEPENAGGALADLGSHIIAMARYLVGPIDAVSGRLSTVHRRRPSAGGALRDVHVDDQADAVVGFACGATGTLSASWIASGWKMGLSFQVTGTKGSIAFTQERLNELQLFSSGGAARTSGFTTILAGPEHPGYGAFCPAAGHQLGYNELKTIEVEAMLDALAGRPSASKDFRFALEVEQIADAIRRSHRDQRWVAVR